MKHRRQITSFNISFLDIMFCGFGAVVLLVLIINSQIKIDTKTKHQDLSSQHDSLSSQITAGQQYLSQLKQALSQTTTSINTSEQDLNQVSQKIKQLTAQINLINAKTLSEKDTIKRLQNNLLKLDQQSEQQRENQNQQQASKIRKFEGEGNRQYLTGLKLGGKRILFLIDMSASMLDEHIVNILVKRNYSQQQQRLSEKWQRAIKTLEWLVANLPVDSNFQIYLFNTTVQPLLSATAGQWVATTDTAKINTMFSKLTKITPAKGTSLINAFLSIKQFNTKPDNIILITDGLPTQSISPSKKTKISGTERVKLFSRAIVKLPAKIPVNTILFPMEGDPMAAALFWKLAIETGGSFFTTSKDWP